MSRALLGRDTIPHGNGAIQSLVLPLYHPRAPSWTTCAAAHGRYPPPGRTFNRLAAPCGGALPTEAACPIGLQTRSRIQAATPVCLRTFFYRYIACKRGHEGHRRLAAMVDSDAFSSYTDSSALDTSFCDVWVRLLAYRTRIWFACAALCTGVNNS